MQTSFYDAHGRAYAYTEDGVHIYTFSGVPVAYIYNGTLYTFSGDYISELHEGLIRDEHGNVVLFADESTNRIPKPTKHAGKRSGLRLMRPPKLHRNICTVSLRRTYAWSRKTPEAIFEANSTNSALSRMAYR